MRRPDQLRPKPFSPPAAAVAFALFVVVPRLPRFGREGRLGFVGFNLAGLVEGIVFLAAFVTALGWVRSALRLPARRCSRSGSWPRPPPAGSPSGCRSSTPAPLQTLADHRVVIVQEGGVPIGVSGMRRERITSWDELVKVAGRRRRDRPAPAAVARAARGGRGRRRGARGRDAGGVPGRAMGTGALRRPTRRFGAQPRRGVASRGRAGRQRQVGVASALRSAGVDGPGLATHGGRQRDHRAVVGGEPGGGRWTCSPAPLRAARRRAFAATPPATTRSRDRWRPLPAVATFTRWSTARRSKAAATSAGGRSGSRSRRTATAVLRPLKLKSKPARCASGEGSATPWVARRGERRQRRPAGVGQTEQPRDLVEGLAGGVVEAAPQSAGTCPRRARRTAPCGHPRRSGTGTAATGSPDATLAATCPSRWCTLAKGTPRPKRDPWRN
jgi:hypothetical protein